jgi:hypothetical protein
MKINKDMIKRYKDFLVESDDFFSDPSKLNSKELVRQIISDMKMDADDIEDADPEFIPHISEKILSFTKQHVRNAVREMIKAENDRVSDPKDIEELTDEALEHFYPLENIK